MKKNTNTKPNMSTEFDISDDEIEEEVVNKIIKKSPSASASAAASRSGDASNVHIPKETIERLLKDIKDIYTI